MMVFDPEKATVIRLDDELPEYPKFDPQYRRAPRRESRLTEADKELAIRNALRYIPKQHHALMAKEFAQELKAAESTATASARRASSTASPSAYTGATASRAARFRS